MLLAGPVSGAVLGAAALYASTREDLPPTKTPTSLRRWTNFRIQRFPGQDFSGAVARKAGSLYLKAGLFFFWISHHNG